MDLGTVDIECPECDVKVAAKIEDIAKGRSVRCRKGHSFRVNDKGGGARKAQKAVDDLDKQMKRMGFK